MSSSDSDSDVVAVVCPACRVTFHAAARDEARDVECPQCFSPVRVPGLQSAATRADTYSLAPVPEQSHRLKPLDTVTVELKCSGCGAAVAAEIEENSRLITCAECFEVVPVPSRDDLKRSPPRRRKRKRAEAAIDSPATKPREREGGANPFEEEPQRLREPPPPVPTWTFFSGVFTLPWRREVLSRWLWMTATCTLLGLSAAGIHWLIVHNDILVIPFIALPIIFLALWGGSYGVSCAMTVLEDTAAGNDAIHDWTDGSFGAWQADAFGPVFLAAVTGTLSYVIAKLAAGWNPAAAWPVFLAAFCLLLPIVMLSSLQAGSHFIPLTGAVLKTLITRPHLWFVYYALAGAVAGAYFALLAVGLSRGQWAATLTLTGPLLSTVLLVEVRLLGRLAWKTLTLPAAIAAEGERRERLQRLNGE